MTSVAELRTHIEKMDTGWLDFSLVELNTRADLVRFEGFSLERAVNIDEGDAYRIMEGADCEADEWEPNHYGFVCKCGSKELKMQWINGYPGRYSSEDGYICKCGCGNEFFVHECALDAWEGE